LALAKYDIMLGFNYLHLVRDMAGILKSANALLVPGGLFIFKTPCIKDITFVALLLPVVSLGRAVGLAPFVAGFTARQLRNEQEATCKLQDWIKPGAAYKQLVPGRTGLRG
jgi:hypothetical protein